MKAWHGGTKKEILEILDTGQLGGLQPAEAERRLGLYGPNRLDKKREKSLLLRVLVQLRDPMIVVLLAAAGLSFWASHGEDWMDALIILIIVGVNACISIHQEGNAARALEALEKMTAPQAHVVRGGQTMRIGAEGLVPGDIVKLIAGDLIPADLRILEAVGLKADESAMTGESSTVGKDALDGLPSDTPLGDRKNMLLSATVVTNGRCTGVVVTTGMDTQVGQIAGLLLEQGEMTTPLQKRMGEISKTLSFVCLCVCALLFGVGLLQGKNLLDMFMMAISLAVAAIPEGLPAIVTIVLALGVQRMASRNAIVKRLPAVETLGCAGVICSDKTGTLTQNKMTVTKVWTQGGTQAEALTIATLCNDAIVVKGEAMGDPTETALVMAAHRDGLEKARLEHEFPRVGELPFDSERKLMTTLHTLPNGGYRIMVKGAPDVLTGRCNLSDSSRRSIQVANDSMAGQALRVLGVAYRDIATLPSTLTSKSLECDLTFVGLIGMIDPPRKEVREAVKQCYAAGIRPVMITGDHKLTAVTIARDLGILCPGDRAITGEDLDFMPQSVLEEEVEKFSVYARVSPEHKMRIVQAWQKRGYVVAMTGDGVNDAPALKAADIGCAMGISGTDVAKGASAMILTDDNFATIVSAVAEGRGIYANIKKAIHYLLSCNIGEMLTISVATLLNFPQMPLLPVQLLWLNLVTDSLPALALGVEPPEVDLMEQRPRGREDKLFDRRFTLRLLWQGCMVGMLTLAGYLLGLELAVGLQDAHAVANTMAFATLTLCQLFHAFDVRSDHRSLFKLGVFTNPAMNRAFVVGMALQLSVLCIPQLQTVFSTVTMTAPQWGCVLGLAIAPVLICESVKAFSSSAPQDRPS